VEPGYFLRAAVVAGRSCAARDAVMLSIVQARDSEELHCVRSLFEEYAASLNFDLCFQNFDQELANLPGEYSLPQGCILLAWQDGQPAGCVAMQKLEDGVCEMKTALCSAAVSRIGHRQNSRRDCHFRSMQDRLQEDMPRHSAIHERGSIALSVDGLQGYRTLSLQPNLRHEVHGAYL